MGQLETKGIGLMKRLRLPAAHRCLRRAVNYLLEERTRLAQESDRLKALAGEASREENQLKRILDSSRRQITSTVRRTQRIRSSRRVGLGRRAPEQAIAADRNQRRTQQTYFRYGRLTHAALLVRPIKLWALSTARYSARASRSLPPDPLIARRAVGHGPSSWFRRSPAP